MWRDINGEMIWMDDVMGYEEVERERLAAGAGAVSYTYGGVRDVGGGFTKGDIVVGVAGGVIAAKVVGRVWGWFWWMVLIGFILMIIM